MARNGNLSGRGVAALFFVVTATALTPLACKPAEAQAEPSQHKILFHIAAGSLSDALVAFSRQSHVQVTSQASSLAGHTTRGLSGAFTPSEGLGQLLQGSGLSYMQAGDHAYQIAPTTKASSIVLGPVRVGGTDSKDPTE